MPALPRVVRWPPVSASVMRQGYLLDRQKQQQQQQKLLRESNALSAAEQMMLDRIRLGSENDPRDPEFPPDRPKFPATPTVKIDVQGFSNVWLKDEGQNPTGTHKDRMAWELVVTYQHFLVAKQQGLTDKPLPAFSIISSGSAAIAIQSRFKEYGLPDLRVLVDENIEPKIERSLRDLGCHVFKTDLSAKALNWHEILSLTENDDGFDVTSAKALDPNTRFYDWLSYEILNNNPEWCFIPYGTGNLFENILNTNKKEIQSNHHDPRFRGNVETWKRCNFIGATTQDPQSKAAVKLYSPHLPFADYDEQWIRFYRTAGLAGPHSAVKLIQEENLDKAIQILQKNNIVHEDSAAISLGMLLQMQDIVPADAKVVVVSTGNAKYP